MKTFIYLIENINGNKIYIGKTVNPSNRKNYHKNKLGNQIKFSIIDEIDSIKKEDWIPLESYWISQFKNWGFNLINGNNGGGGPSILSEEHKIKIGISNSKPKPENFGGKVSQWLIGNSFHKGMKHSEETKVKMRKPKPEGFGKILRDKKDRKKKINHVKGPNKNLRPDIGKKREYKKRIGKPRGNYNKSND